MIQKLIRGWGSNPAPIEAMSAMMALAFALTVAFGFTFPGLDPVKENWFTLVVWYALALAGSVPYFVGWVLDKTRLRNACLFWGATFWAQNTVTSALAGDAHAVPWVIIGGFAGWAFLNRRRRHV